VKKINIVFVLSCLLILLVSGQSMAKKKPKTLPDLEIVKTRTIVRMGPLKNKICTVQVQSRVKNLGDKTSTKSESRFLRDDGKGAKEYTYFPINELKGGESTFNKEWPTTGTNNLAESDYEWTFTVDPVLGEYTQEQRDNNSHKFICNCGKKKKQTCSSKK